MNQLIREYPFIASIILSIALSVWIIPSKTTQGIWNWGRHGAALGALVGSLPNLARVFRQAPATAEMTNAIAIWAFSTVILAGLGFAIGAITFKMIGSKNPQPHPPAQPSSDRINDESGYTKTDKLMIAVILTITFGSISLFMLLPR